MRKLKLFSILSLLFMAATGAMAQTETLLTTITATAKEQANYSTANVATVSFSYTAGGASAYLANWGWWGYGWSATVNAAEGYTITKCIFYDDANRTATDSEAPFVVETTEEDKTPRINGTPIDGGNYQSKGIKKIEVYGYENPTTVNVTGITLSQTEAAVTIGGETLTLTATVAPDDATDKTVTWTSSDPTVATVANGVVTAVAAGTATITATATNGTDDTTDDKTATCTITVTDPDQEAADAVLALFDALPAADAVTLDDKTAIEAARAAYDALTDDQKALVTPEDLAKLTAVEESLAAAEKATADQQEADAVVVLFDALPAVADITLEDKAAIEAARAAYDALTDDQKALVSAEELAKLTAAEEALAAAEKSAADQEAANDVVALFDALPAADAVTLNDKEAIEAARAAYEALTDEQKALVSPEDLAKLTDAEATLAAAEKAAADQEAANAVVVLFDALPAADAVTLDDKEAIEAARAAYDALTADQKALVSPEDLAKLTAAEEALAELESQGVENIQGNVKNVKTMVNGQIFILRGEKVYTLQGQEVK